MQNKLISIIIGAVLVVGTGTLVYSSIKPAALPAEKITPTKTVVETVKNTINKITNDDEEDGVPTPTTVVPTTVVQTTTKTTTGGITLAQISQHNSRTSCWSAVNEGVYDLTSWIPNHPGGEQNILSMCGVDGSTGYNGQHSGGTKPAFVLGGFKIGTLAK